MLMILFLGFSSLTKLQRDNYPPVDLGELTIQTIYPGAEPEDVELNVTNKIEDSIKSIPGIKTIKSYSMENLSYIKVTLDPDIKDQDKVKGEIREAINRITNLPPEVEDAPLISEVKTSIFPILEVGITGDLPYHDLRDIAGNLDKKIKIRCLP